MMMQLLKVVLFFGIFSSAHADCLKVPFQSSGWMDSPALDQNALQRAVQEIDQYLVVHRPDFKEDCPKALSDGLLAQIRVRLGAVRVLLSSQPNVLEQDEISGFKTAISSLSLSLLRFCKGALRLGSDEDPGYREDLIEPGWRVDGPRYYALAKSVSLLASEKYLISLGYTQQKIDEYVALSEKHYREQEAKVPRLLIFLGTPFRDSITQSEQMSRPEQEAENQKVEALSNEQKASSNTKAAGTSAQ